MKTKIAFLVVVTLFIYVANILFENTVSPGPVSDMAIAQMERSDEAATALRTTHAFLAWQFPVSVVVWVLFALWIFHREVLNGFEKVKKEFQNEAVDSE
ncbi:MAG: hypothetical protein ACXABY_03310 [Candidatus Thorarchaeota archaeon]|jgi:hypothetical protein